MDKFMQKNDASHLVDIKDAVSKHKNWFLILGIALVVLGILAISVSALTTLISVVFIGVMLAIGGVVVIFDTFKFWWGKWSGFFFYLIMGMLYLTVGAMLIRNPILGAVSLTFLLGLFYTGLGIFRIVVSLSLRVPMWGWSFFSGILATFLGILILTNWPKSSLIIIGLFVGIDLLFVGWPYIMLAFSVRKDKEMVSE